MGKKMKKAGKGSDDRATLARAVMKLKGKKGKKDKKSADGGLKAMAVPGDMMPALPEGFGDVPIDLQDDSGSDLSDLEMVACNIVKNKAKDAKEKKKKDKKEKKEK